VVDSLPWVWTDSIAGLERASQIVVLGADPYHRQPIVDLRIRKAIRKGARVWVVTSEPNRLDRLAAGVIRYASEQTGTIARALLSIVLNEGLARRPVAAPSPTERARKAGSRKDATLAVAKSGGADVEALRALAREIAGARGAVLLYDEMATREPGAENVAADVLQLAQLTDNLGRPGAGCGPLFEDNNSLGARDMGLLPDLLPGYRPVADAAARAALGSAWGLDLPELPGKSYDEMLSGGVRALYVMGADPARHATPEQLARLEALPFIVVQDLFLTETARRANVVLPALSYAEKDGTFTNTERCVQVVRQAMTPLPRARADWQILTGLAHELSLGWTYASPAEILAEIARTVPLYAGASRRTLGYSGARWPLAPGAPDAEGRPTVMGSPFLTRTMLEPR
jgi:predicted molibdopterin-dependent oxidoreductase YjgC